MNRTTLRTGAAVLVGAGLLAGASMATAVSGTMPAAAPSDGGAVQIQQAIAGSKLGGTATVKYFYMSNGGGQVIISPEKQINGGMTGVQTVTITPPSGSPIVQGMATISGGQLGAMIIKSTTVTASKYVITLNYPGNNGTPGKLTWRLQLSN